MIIYHSSKQIIRSADCMKITCKVKINIFHRYDLCISSAGSTSLGTLLSDASSIWTNYPHLMIYPALILSLLMICFNLFGNGLRDAFNPSLRGVED